MVPRKAYLGKEYGSRAQTMSSTHCFPYCMTHKSPTWQNSGRPIEDTDGGPPWRQYSESMGSPVLGCGIWIKSKTYIWFFDPTGWKCGLGNNRYKSRSVPTNWYSLLLVPGNCRLIRVRVEVLVTKGSTLLPGDTLEVTLNYKLQLAVKHVGLLVFLGHESQKESPPSHKS